MYFLKIIFKTQKQTIAAPVSSLGIMPLGFSTVWERGVNWRS
jgi:hypothetical protein